MSESSLLDIYEHIDIAITKFLAAYATEDGADSDSPQRKGFEHSNPTNRLARILFCDVFSAQFENHEKAPIIIFPSYLEVWYREKGAAISLKSSISFPAWKQLFDTPYKKEEIEHIIHSSGGATNCGFVKMFFDCYEEKSFPISPSLMEPEYTPFPISEGLFNYKLSLSFLTPDQDAKLKELIEPIVGRFKDKLLYVNFAFINDLYLAKHKLDVERVKRAEKNQLIFEKALKHMRQAQEVLDEARMADCTEAYDYLELALPNNKHGIRSLFVPGSYKYDLESLTLIDKRKDDSDVNLVNCSICTAQKKLCDTISARNQFRQIDAIHEARTASPGLWCGYGCFLREISAKLTEHPAKHHVVGLLNELSNSTENSGEAKIRFSLLKTLLYEPHSDSKHLLFPIQIIYPLFVRLKYMDNGKLTIILGSKPVLILDNGTDFPYNAPIISSLCDKNNGYVSKFEQDHLPPTRFIGSVLRLVDEGFIRDERVSFAGVCVTLKQDGFQISLICKNVFSSEKLATLSTPDFTEYAYGALKRSLHNAHNALGGTGAISLNSNLPDSTPKMSIVEKSEDATTVVDFYLKAACPTAHWEAINNDY